MLLVALREKKNLHTDEVLTYILANNTVNEHITVGPEMGKTYIPADSAWTELMTVQRTGRFDYANVWEKQASDVHPPFYYVLIHTICSFFPGVYSKWFAGGVNILFVLLSFWLFRKTVWELTKSGKTVFFCSAFFCISSGVLSAATFLRMYMMLMFWFLLLTYLLLRGMGQRSWRFYAAIFLAAVAGVLTHYYFVVYLFFSCIVWGIYLLIKKQYRDFLYSVLVMFAAAGAVIAIFPASIQQSIGGGYRGVNTIQNLMDFSPQGIWYRFRECYRIVNQQLFGGLFLLLLVLLVICGAVLTVRVRKRPQADAVFRWFIVALPGILYFFLVSKIAVYLTDRYFHPIYPMLVIMTIGALTVLFERLLRWRIAWVAVCMLFLTVSMLHWRDSWHYLYRSSGRFLSQTQEHADNDALFLFEYAYELPAAYYEANSYRSLTFLSMRDLEMLRTVELDVTDGLVVILGNGCDRDKAFSAVQKRFATLTQVQEMGGYSATTSFYLK